MTIHQIGIGFHGRPHPLLGRDVTARGLHGVLYTVLRNYDPQGANWLHRHRSPKPYNLTPYYDTESGTLAGIRLGAMTDDAADLLYHAWEEARVSGCELALGRQPFLVSRVTMVPVTTFELLSGSTPAATLGLRFLSPTAFKQGPGHLPLPLPYNVFQTPYRAWNAFAPHRLLIPSDWCDWCADDVFVAEHHIQTAAVTINHREPPFVGFVGEVWFEARSDALLYLSLFQGLGQLAAFSGVGHKTTMGMGAVELIGKDEG